MRNHTGEETRQALICAVLKRHVDAVLEVLRAAGLKVMSVSFGLIPIFESVKKKDSIYLFAHKFGLDMGISSGESLVTLRSFSDVIDSGPDGVSVDAKNILRDLKITLGQIPEEQRQKIRNAFVFGHTERLDSIVEDLEKGLLKTGIQINAAQSPGAESLDPEADLKSVSPAAFSFAFRNINGFSSSMELMPPRISRLKKIADIVSKRGTIWISAAAITLLFIIVITFYFQSRYLNRLQKKWIELEPEYQAAELIQDNIRKYRPWFGNSIRSLVIMEQITSAFPEEGTVYVKSLEFRNLSKVTCTGESESNREWLKMLEKLRKIPGIEGLQVQQVRGEKPLGFTFTFTSIAGEE
jgi:hypothetical protein